MNNQLATEVGELANFFDERILCGSRAIKPIAKTPDSTDWKVDNLIATNSLIINPSTALLSNQQIEEVFCNGMYQIVHPRDLPLKSFVAADMLALCSETYAPEQLLGLESVRWLIQNLQKIPTPIKSGEDFYFPGTVFLEKMAFRMRLLVAFSLKNFVLDFRLCIAAN